MVVFAFLIVAFLCIFAYVLYGYLAKREERQMQRDRLDHERDQSLDEMTFGTDTIDVEDNPLPIDDSYQYEDEKERD